MKTESSRPQDPSALETSRRLRDAARARMENAPRFSPKWRQAEEDLCFWQGKVAFLTAAG